MAAVANENLRANLIYGEIYFVSFDFTRGIYFNMLLYHSYNFLKLM